MSGIKRFVFCAGCQESFFICFFFFDQDENIKPDSREAKNTAVLIPSHYDTSQEYFLPLT